MKALIGEQIKKIREQNGISQEEISAVLGMSRQRFARIEKGISDVSYDTIVSIANYFKIETKQITDVCECVEVVSFRTGSASSGTFEQIEEMISFFYANKSMYKRLRVDNNDEF